MKKDRLRPPGFRRVPAIVAPIPHSAVARLSSGLAIIRHRDNAMRTRGQPIEGFSAWNPSDLRIWRRTPVGRATAHGHAAISGGRSRAGNSPAVAPWLSPKRIDPRPALRSPTHLWLVLRSEPHRRGAQWETASFLAILLSGLIGVALCILG